MLQNPKKSIIFLGDTHGDFNVIFQLCKKHENNLIIHCGDVGIGFPSYSIWNKYKQKFETRGQDPESFPENFKMIAGNHDDKAKMRQYPNYLGDYGYDKERDMFFVSGAWSIDHERRRSGIDWWPNEELSMEQFHYAMELYDKTRPKIMVTHTCPQSIANQLMQSSHKRYMNQRTEIALDRMFEIHKPQYWIFGHWHQVWRKNILGTDFVCLPINGKLELDI